jgi:putative ABC transport system permease protein
MIKNYLTIAWRNLLRNKIFSIINILGLAIGFSVCFLILQYVFFEYSYDRFHTNADRIYRVTVDFSWAAGPALLAANHPGVGPAMKADYPEVEEYARIVHQSIFIGKVATWSHADDSGIEKIFNEDRVYCADPSFLKMFDFPFLYGDPESALDDASAVVISESVSKKFFGAVNPIGETMTLNGWRDFTVTGVFKDVVENSHIKFDILLTYFLPGGWNGNMNLNSNWSWPEYFTYVRLVPDADPKDLEAKLDDFIHKYESDRLRSLGAEEHFYLQPLTDIHLRSPKMTKEQEIHGSEQSVLFLLLIAALILVIAWFNYIILSTSASIRRAQEVGLRKVAGASKSQLVTQFLCESAMINLLAMVISLILISLAFPFFIELAGKNIGHNLISSGLLNDQRFWLTLLGVFLIGSFLAGLYPAFALSSFRAVGILKGRFFGSKSGIALRKTLVGSQFAISVALIAGTIVVSRQVSFMRGQELGYIKDRLLVVKSPNVGDSTFNARFEVFKTGIKRNPDINSMAPSTEIPGKPVTQVNSIRRADVGVENTTRGFHYYTDHEFFDTYGIRILAGRNFRENESVVPSDGGTSPIIINEKLAEALGYENASEAANQLVICWFGTEQRPVEIIGVAENHHQQSLRGSYDPIIFFPQPGISGTYYTINLSMRNPSETISFIKDQYEKAFPGNQFEYFFLDDFFDRQYAGDQRFGKVFGLFSGLALFVAGLGLFGLSHLHDLPANQGDRREKGSGCHDFKLGRPVLKGFRKAGGHRQPSRPAGCVFPCRQVA